MKKVISLVWFAILVIALLSVFVFVWQAVMSHVPPSNLLPTLEKTPHSRAICNDGVFSNSSGRTGTCSGHGGVKEWIK